MEPTWPLRAMSYNIMPTRFQCLIDSLSAIILSLNISKRATEIDCYARMTANEEQQEVDRLAVKPHPPQKG